MNILFSGIGGIGGRHARLLRSMLPDAHFTAVRRESNEMSRALGMDIVETLEQGLAEHPDAAIVALPPSLHGMIACKILAAGIALYLEKPVALQADEIQDAVVQAESDGVVTMAGCNLRYLPGFRAIRDMISHGDLGTIFHARLSVGQWLPDWRPERDYKTTYSAQRALGGGVLFDLIHELDLARYLFGEFDRVKAAAGRSGALEIDCEDWAEVLLQNDNSTVSVHLDYLDRPGHRHGHIHGTNGTLKYDVLHGTISRFDAKTGRWSALGDGPHFTMNDSYAAALRHFIDCVKRKRQTNQPISEGLGTLRLAEAARRDAGIAS